MGQGVEGMHGWDPRRVEMGSSLGGWTLDWGRVQSWGRAGDTAQLWDHNHSRDQSEPQDPTISARQRTLRPSRGP